MVGETGAGSLAARAVAPTGGPTGRAAADSDEQRRRHRVAEEPTPRRKREPAATPLRKPEPPQPRKPAPLQPPELGRIERVLEARQRDRLVETEPQHHALQLARGNGQLL